MQNSIFKRRRSKFAEKMVPGSVAVLAAAPVRIRNGDVEYEYRQDSDFYYLTGFEEPDSLCVLTKDDSEVQFTLFVRPRDPEKEAWTGIRAGLQGAVETFGADYAYENHQIEETLPLLTQNRDSLYYAFNKNHDLDLRVLKMLENLKLMQRSGISAPARVIDPTDILAEMRLIKTPEDIEILQRAIDISTQGHLAAIKSAAPDRYEYQLQAEIEYVFRSNGSKRNGYPVIVGSGPNACILHYTQNNRQMMSGDLVLIDAGAEYEYYTGDITRTFPVSGRFTAQQKDLYELVLHAQKLGIGAAVAGNSFSDVHMRSLRALTEGVLRLGLLSGSLDENIETGAYKKYFLHRTSHWLGMDVHDAGRYKIGDQSRMLENGMVLTVEPGLYISGQDQHEAFRNIGIRIEDDVLIRKEGPLVLSSACPKEIADLETLIGSGK
jgi:Xaa-Pro aminopeptidase